MIDMNSKQTSLPPAKVGLSLKIARLKLGFTQQMLADFARVGISTIQRAERGCPLRPDSVYLLCQYFSERYQREVLPVELGLSWEYRIPVLELQREA